MSDFFLGHEEHMEACRADAERAYEHKMLRALLAGMYGSARAAALEREAGDEFGFDWFNRTAACPLALHADNFSKATSSVVMNSARMPETELWRRYFDVKAEHPRDAFVGLIFRVSGMGEYVMHNCATFSKVPGYNIIFRQASTPDKGLVIMPWKAFLAGLSRLCVQG